MQPPSNGATVHLHKSSRSQHLPLLFLVTSLGVSQALYSYSLTTTFSRSSKGARRSLAADLGAGSHIIRFYLEG